MSQSRLNLIAIALPLIAAPALGAEKATQFWNLTSSTVTKLEISKAGANAFGPNQTINDPDGTVDHDERLKIVGVGEGVFDVRLTLKDGRVCLVKGLTIRKGKPFSIEDKNLVDCAKV